MFLRVCIVIWAAVWKSSKDKTGVARGDGHSQPTQGQTYDNRSFLKFDSSGYFTSISQGTASKCQHQSSCTWPIFANLLSTFQESLLAWICSLCLAGCTVQYNIIRGRASTLNSSSVANILQWQKKTGHLQHRTLFNVKTVTLQHRSKSKI